jgi:hypothetical protein
VNEAQPQGGKGGIKFERSWARNGDEEIQWYSVSCAIDVGSDIVGYGGGVVSSLASFSLFVLFVSWPVA